MASLASRTRNEFARMLEGRELPDPLDRVRTSEDGMTVVSDGAPDGEGDTGRG